MYRKKFIVIGKILPKSIKIDCFEKKPEFLIEYFIRYVNPIASKIYEYKECTIAYGPVIHSFKLVEYTL